MRYVLKHKETGKYVADQRKRSGPSYTAKLEHAKVYETKEAAKADSCIESEYVIPLDNIFNC